MAYDGVGRFALPDEHAIPLTDETSPAWVIASGETALGAVHAVRMTIRLANEKPA